MLQFLGRLHPALVHFPIALLLVAVLAELVRRRADGPSETAFFCLALGTLGALAAVLTGLLFAAHDPPGAHALLERHRWSGIGTAAAACATLVSAWRWRRTGAATLAAPTRLGLVLTAALVGLSGHLGGSMVYGEGFELEPLRARAPARVQGASLGATGAGVPEGGAADPVASPGNPPAKPVDFLTDVRPILERRCFECHGERKRPKGKLKLSDMASVLARDPSDAALVPGDPAASLIYQRITLPRDNEDAMPPEDGPLTPGEIDTIRRWIAEGAHWREPVRDAPSAGG